MRRQPRQERSRALVQCLVDAAAQVIASEGLESATTARIAARAGVSVGSVYQYFDRKEDLYEAVLESLVAHLEALVTMHARKGAGKGLSDFIRDLLSDIWDFLETDQQRYLHVARYWAQLDSSRHLAALEKHMIGTVSLLIVQSPARSAAPAIAANIYILVNSIIFTLVRYISDPQPGISREELIAGLAGLGEKLLFAD